MDPLIQSTLIGLVFGSATIVTYWVMGRINRR